jgi:hypothetical protein
VIGYIAPSAWRDTSKLCKQNSKPLSVDAKNIPSSANSSAPAIPGRVQYLTNFICKPTWHAKELRQLALASAFDTVVCIQSSQIMVGQIQQALLGCRK